MDIKAGDHFIVQINGNDYDTVIDEHGVQRFVPNRIVAAFVDAALSAYNTFITTNPIEERDWSKAPFGLNDIDYTPNGTYTLDELIQFSTLHGYSVGGMCDLSFMSGVEVINPLWD